MEADGAAAQDDAVGTAKRRSWFRLHLSTALVLMLAASAYVGVNVLYAVTLEEHSTSYPGAGGKEASVAVAVKAFGWPFSMREETLVTTSNKTAYATEQFATLGETKGNEPIKVTLPSHYFVHVGEQLRMETGILPAQISKVPEFKIDFLWSCTDPADLKIPPKFAANSTLVFVPRAPGLYNFQCICTGPDKKSATLRTWVWAGDLKVTARNGWNNRNVTLNATFGVAGLLVFAVIIEWRVRRRRAR